MLWRFEHYVLYRLVKVRVFPPCIHINQGFWFLALDDSRKHNSGPGSGWRLNLSLRWKLQLWVRHVASCRCFWPRKHFVAGWRLNGTANYDTFMHHNRFAVWICRRDQIAIFSRIPPCYGRNDWSILFDQKTLGIQLFDIVRPMQISLQCFSVSLAKMMEAEMADARQDMENRIRDFHIEAASHMSHMACQTVWKTMENS